jgi:hypothetical protein
MSLSRSRCSRAPHGSSAGTRSTVGDQVVKGSSFNTAMSKGVVISPPVAVHVEIPVIGATVGQPMDERRQL